MNIPSRRKPGPILFYQRKQRQQQKQKHHIFYFLSALILLAFSGIDSTSANLYSEFNKDLDVVSNLAENKVKSETAPVIDEIYEKSGKLLENPFVDVLSDEDMEKLERIIQVEKLTDISDSAYYKSPGDSKENRIFRRQNGNSGRFKGRARNYRNIIDGNFRGGSEIFLENKGLSINGNQWPNIVERAVPAPFHSNDDSYLGNSPRCALNRKSRCPKRPKRKNSQELRNLRKRFNVPLPLLNPNSVLNTASSLYPGIMAKTSDLIGANLAPAMGGTSVSSPLKLDLSALAASTGLSNGQAASAPPLPSLSQIKEFQDLLLQHTPRQVSDREAGCDMQQSQSQPQSVGNSCEQITANVSNALERVLSELEKIRDAKGGNSSSVDGDACHVNGFWNSEIAGVRFDISVVGNDSVCPIDLNVNVKKRKWKLQNTLMDTSWTCRGSSLNKKGGPFYLAAKKKSDNGLATFTGFCMRCEGCDIVFGAWTIVNPCTNCTGVSMAIETKRDVFRRDMDEEKKAKEKEEREKEKADKNSGCLSEPSEGHDQSEYHEGFNSDTFYEYF